LSANRTFYIDLFGTAPGTKVVSTSLGGNPATDNCVKWIAGGKLGDAGAACGSGGGSHNILSATHSDTTAASVVRGDGFFGVGATPTWQRVAHSATSGGYWKWNGTDVVASTNAAAGTGSCTNQAVTGLNADSAPSCTTLTSSYVDTSIAKTGTDINTSNQVTATHLSSPLPAAQGGTNNAYFQVSGPASAVKTFTFPNADATIEYQANRNAASGYAGLDSGSRIAKAQAPSVTVYTDAANTYTAGQKQTHQSSATTAGFNLASSADPSTPAQGDVWINTEALKWRGASATYSATPQSRNVSTSSPLGGGGTLTSDLTLTCATCEVTGNKNAANGYAGVDSGSRIAKAQGPSATVYTDQSNTFSTGTQDFESASVTRPFRRLAYASFPGSCTANREFLERSDPGTAGQVLYICNSGGNGWDLVGDGGGGGGSSWSSLGDPTANKSFAMGHFTTLWTFDATTGSGVDLFKITDTANNTGTGALLRVEGASGTAAVPLVVKQTTVSGSTDIFQVYNATTKAFWVNGYGQAATGYLVFADNVIQGVSADRAITVQSGLDSQNSQGALTLRGGDVTGGTGVYTAGGTTLRGGDSASNNASASAGNLTIRSGQQTANTSAAQGTISIQTSYLKGAAATANDAVCLSANNTVVNCPTSATNPIGVADTVGTNNVLVAFSGQHTVNYDSTYSPSAGWYACTSATTAGQVIPQAAACATGRQVGIVTAGGTGVTSGSMQVLPSYTITGGGGITTLNTLTAATQSFANGTAGTAPAWSSVTDTHTLNIPMAATASVTAGLLSKTDYDAFNGKPNLVGSGTGGVGPSKVGTAATAARSDHDHRSVHAMSWYFPGTPATGVQNLKLTFPDGAIANMSILDMRVTVNTVSAASSTFNVQRCVVSSVACSATQSTWVDIYSTVLTLAASNYTVAKGSAPNQNVGSLVAGDQFKASLVTIGASLADVTVEMTYKYDTKN
jgi:hypothetical protein